MVRSVVSLGESGGVFIIQRQNLGCVAERTETLVSLPGNRKQKSIRVAQRAPTGVSFPRCRSPQPGRNSLARPDPAPDKSSATFESSGARMIAGRSQVASGVVQLPF